MFIETEMICGGSPVTLYCYGDKDSGYEVFYEDEEYSIDHDSWTQEMKDFVVQIIGEYNQMDGVSVEVLQPII